MSIKYKRILLKLSGEALMGDQPFGIQSDQLQHYAAEIKTIADAGVEIAIVIGGGNIFRGLSAEKSGVERVQGDYMGMLATVINGMALQSGLEKAGVYTRLQSAIKMEQICEPFIRRKAVRHLEKGRVVIFGAGTKVDGIYTSDPKKDADATKYSKISFKEAIDQSLGVMDMTAFTICQENKLPIIVFDVTTKGNLLKIIQGETNLGTLVT